MSKEMDDYKQTRQMIEHWIAQTHRMYADPRKSIQPVRQIQDKLIEQTRTLGPTHRVAPWAERNQ